MIDSPTDVKSIFGRALDLKSPSELARYLDEACGCNLALRAEVEDLMGAVARAGSFLAAATSGEPPRRGQAAEGVGGSIGRYKLLEQIGEGDMGLVYMAVVGRFVPQFRLGCYVSQWFSLATR